MTMVFAVGLWIFGAGLLGLLVFVVWTVALVDLFRHPDLDRRQRAGWILVIVLLPLIGTVLYFMRRPMPEEERERYLAAATRRR
jgi:hypothetical protein